MILTNSQARTFYDNFGIKQDSQAFYEDAALDDLIRHAEFQNVNSVFEFGCGTGRFASKLLANHLSASATYNGIDISPTMIEIAQRRVADYPHANVMLSDGTLRFPLHDHSVERIISTYVLDLLSEADIQQFFTEARRVLMPGGKLCLVSLTNGVTFATKFVSGIWNSVFHIHAPLVGGCRPVQLHQYVDPALWITEHHAVICRYGIPSEVLITIPK